MEKGHLGRNRRFGQSWAFEGKQMWKRDHLVEICKETLGEYGAFKGNWRERGDF